MKTTIKENHSLPVSKHLQSSILIGSSENKQIFEQEITSFKSVFVFLFVFLRALHLEASIFTPMTQ